MTRYQFRSVTPDNGAVLIHVTAHLPLGITKEVRIRLKPEDALRCIAAVKAALDTISGMRPQLPPR